ncbi:hypothetical protein [Janthinobacterium sp. LB3P118]|uniref:hypothetical protein n=1 Tax=Janthinobacterium sp. LB3P118 TaxID=3424195 RepID=UPI003F28EA0E
MQYLFKEHGEKKLRKWARRLKLFRFFRALGGHANDGDSLDVAFAYGEPAQLDTFLASLGIKLVKFDAQPPQPLPGIAYQGDEYLRFPSLIDGTLWQQPGRCDIMGIGVFIWCHAGVVKISLHDGYAVSEQNVRDAAAIEKLLAWVLLERIDPPADSRQYFCP